MNKKKGFHHSKTLYVTVASLVLLLTACLATTVAYFTAVSRRTGNINFATLEVALANNGTELSSTTLPNTILRNLQPGDTVNLNGDTNKISVKNIGEADVYALAVITYSIGDNDYTYWYNFAGQEVNFANITANTTEATLVSAGSTTPLNVNIHIPGSLDNTFMNATVSMNINIHAIQTLLPDNSAFSTKALQAVNILVTSEG